MGVPGLVENQRDGSKRLPPRFSTTLLPAAPGWLNKHGRRCSLWHAHPGATRGLGTLLGDLPSPSNDPRRDSPFPPPTFGWLSLPLRYFPVPRSRRKMWPSNSLWCQRLHQRRTPCTSSWAKSAQSGGSSAEKPVPLADAGRISSCSDPTCRLTQDNSLRAALSASGHGASMKIWDGSSGCDGTDCGFARTPTTEFWHRSAATLGYETLVPPGHLR
jgi:hypothetical protein